MIFVISLIFQCYFMYHMLNFQRNKISLESGRGQPLPSLKIFINYNGLIYMNISSRENA